MASKSRSRPEAKCIPPRKQRCLILTNVLGAKLIGGAMEVPAEMFDRLDISVDGGLGVVAAP